MAKEKSAAFDLLAELKANTKSSIIAIELAEHFEEVRPSFSSDVPILDLLMSGKLWNGGGCPSGIHAIAGPSKHFKSTFGILLASRFLKKYPDGVVLFYDSEGGTTRAYWKGFGADESRVIYLSITTVEEFSSDVLQRLERIQKDQKVLILIDSLGNTPSNKEVADALKGEEKVDMTRAKALKAFWRQVAGPIKRKNLWCISINHTYKTQEMFSKDVVSGGTGTIYNADAVWILGRRQEKGNDVELKENNVVVGYNFIFNVYKSRFIRENVAFPLEVRYASGINKCSGLFELATQFGFLVKQGLQYTRPLIDLKGEKLYKKDIDAIGMEYWTPLLDLPQFINTVESAYCIPDINMFDESAMEEINIDFDVETGEVL